METPSGHNESAYDNAVKERHLRGVKTLEDVLFWKYVEMGNNYTPDLNAALAKAQKAYPQHLRFDKEITVKFGGAGYTHRYASLAAIIEHTQDALNDNGLSIVHTIEDNMIRGSLRHASGQVLESELDLSKYGNKRWQDLGGSITYAARYVLAPLLGVSGIDDIDAPLEDGASLELRDVGNSGGFDPAKSYIDDPAKANWLIENSGMKGKQVAERLGVERLRDYKGTVLEAYTTLVGGIRLGQAIVSDGVLESNQDVRPQEGIPVPNLTE